MEIKLVRETSTGEFTRGEITLPSGLVLQSLELPYKNNEDNISCIPTGTYTCISIFSPKFGKTFEITKVPNRDHILFHSGNVAQDTHGCILLGMRKVKDGILKSKLAMEKFLTELKDCKSFELIIS